MHPIEGGILGGLPLVTGAALSIAATMVVGCTTPGPPTADGSPAPADIVIGLRDHPRSRGSVAGNEPVESATESRRADRTIDWSIAPPPSPDAIAALEALRAAVESEPLAAKVVLTSDDGRAVALFHVDPWHWEDDPRPAPGVVIWPEWRRTGTALRFSDMGKAEFVSNHHVRLSFRPRGEAGVAAIVDLRAPGTRFVFSDARLGTLRIADSGRWVALGRDGVLRHGRLDPSDPERSVIGQPVPGCGSMRNALWLDGDRLLAVERDGPEISVLDGSDWSVRSTVSATMGPEHSRPSTVGTRSFNAWRPGVGTQLFTVAADGSLGARRLQLSDDDEYLLRASPSGRLAVTQDAFGKFSSEPRQIRELDSSLVGDRIPSAMPMPRLDGLQFAGWLAWP